MQLFSDFIVHRDDHPVAGIGIVFYENFLMVCLQCGVEHPVWVLNREASCGFIGREEADDRIVDMPHIDPFGRGQICSNGPRFHVLNRQD